VEGSFCKFFGNFREIFRMYPMEANDGYGTNERLQQTGWPNRPIPEGPRAGAPPLAEPQAEPLAARDPRRIPQ
jgi:hypothetical protein